MIVFEDSFTTDFNYHTFIALGSFDGLHRGHMSLINKTLELSKQNNIKSMVYTFKNHPLTTINKNIAPKLIMDNKTKIDILDEYGIDIINLAQFDKNFMHISPENFIFAMVKCYKPKGFIVGFNYRFGYKNHGDVKILKKLCDNLNVELYVMDSVEYKNDIISSTRIRECISKGDIIDANKMLIRPYMLQGKIIQGKQLGHKIGFPTANLEFPKEFVVPGRGVYFTCLEYNNKIYKGITNVGFNPTVQDNKLSIETHILDFYENIYGREVKVYFLEKIRNEVKFDSIEELRIQLLKDKIYAEKKEIDKDILYTNNSFKAI